MSSVVGPIRVREDPGGRNESHRDTRTGQESSGTEIIPCGVESPVEEPQPNTKKIQRTLRGGYRTRVDNSSTPTPEPTATPRAYGLDQSWRLDLNDD